MRNEIAITIGKRKWRIRFVLAKEMPRDWLGSCDHPPGRHPTIRVRRDLTDRQALEIVAHECLHAALPDLSEEAVTASASVIGRALYSLGYRRKPLVSPGKANQ